MRIGDADNGCQCWQSPNAGLTLVQQCFSTIHYPNPLTRVASHRRVLQHLYIVGTTLARPFQFWRHGNLKTKKFFGDTEIWRLGNFNICTTIPDLDTTHPLPWIGCEQIWETLELVVLKLLMLYKVVLKTVHKHQPTNKNLSFASCLNFVKTL